MLTKQEKEKLTAAERAEWKDESMVKHCTGRAMLLFEVRGKLVPIEKTTIATRFCFGYSDYVPGDFDDANRMAVHASSSEGYFIRKNHEAAVYARTIGKLNDKRYFAYAMPTYGNPESVYSICFQPRWDTKDLPENAFILTDEEIQTYKRKLADACKLHHKKIIAYLKRYGLTKMESWSYWRDE